MSTTANYTDTQFTQITAPCYVTICFLSAFRLTTNSLLIFTTIKDRKQLKSRSNVLIAILAFYDVLTNIMLLHGSVMSLMGNFPMDNPACFFILSYAIFSMNAGAIMIVMLGIDRLLAITIPFKYNTFNESKFVINFTLPTIIYGFSVVYFGYANISADVEPEICILPTALRNFALKYFISTNLIICILVIIVYSVCYCKATKLSNANSSSKSKILDSLLIIIGVYVGSWFMTVFTLQMLATFETPEWFEFHASLYVGLGAVINASCNPIIYYFRSSECEANHVCFTKPVDLGCFYVNDTNPYCKDQFVPQSPQYIQPEFHFFSASSPGTQQNIDFLNDLDGSVAALQADWNRPLTVIVHGFQGGPKTWLVDAKNSIEPYNTNVLLVYWQKGSGGGVTHIDYWQATANVRITGAMMGYVSKTLMAKYPQIQASQLTLMGFSLGAHVAAFAANHIQAATGKQVDRIIGLDPAGPLFACEGPEVRLDPTDAAFVQAIHTDGAPFLNYQHGFGTTEAMGHVDFYVNGGRTQPGCHALSIHIACSHDRAHEVFIASTKYLMNPTAQCVPFVAGRCASSENWENGDCFAMTKDVCNKMAFDLTASDGCMGQYYFATADTPSSPIIDFFGQQYLAQMTFLKQSDSRGQMNVQFLFNGTPQPIADTWFTYTSTSLENTISRPVVAACDSLSLSAHHKPNAITVTFNSEEIIGPSSIRVREIQLTLTDGQSMKMQGPFTFHDKQAITLTLPSL